MNKRVSHMSPHRSPVAQRRHTVSVSRINDWIIMNILLFLCTQVSDESFGPLYKQLNWNIPQRQHEISTFLVLSMLVEQSIQRIHLKFPPSYTWTHSLTSTFDTDEFPFHVNINFNQFFECGDVAINRIIYSTRVNGKMESGPCN